MNRPWLDGNNVELLINGEAYYPRVFEAMSQAQEEILLEPSFSSMTRSDSSCNRC